MEDYESKWAECLQMIRDKYGDRFRHWFDVWYGDVRFESYDADTRTLLVQVPSKYVYEFLETNGAKDLRWTTTEVFKANVILQYRIIAQTPSFADIAAYLQQYGYDARRDPHHISIPDARKRMEDGLRYFVGDGWQWLPGYDKMAEWLTDNKGRGLLVCGTTGLGKTLLCEKILPVILGNGGRPIPCVNASELHGRLDDLKRERILVIDDLGKEPRKYFGNIDNSFFELCNNAERTGNLLVITTNLSTNTIDDPRYPDSIEHRYGPEVIDRLKVITRAVVVRGESLRA